MPGKLFKYILVGSSLLLSGMAGAADGATPAKLTFCTGCHGKNGISAGLETPNLAGQKKGYLINAMNDYRSGNRKNA